MPAPNLTGHTAQSLRIAAFQKWQDLAGSPASEGTPEKLMIEVIAYLAGLHNASVQQSAEGGLINYALGERLDEIGVLFGLSRRLNESDDDYRLRVIGAPSTYTTAGTKEQIETLVKQVDPIITDVSAQSLIPPNVGIRFITKDGLPSAPLLAKVLAALSDPKVKPAVVTFSVSAPIVVNYSIAATITPFSNADPDTIKERCVIALNKYVKEVSALMGKDVVVNQLIAVLQGVTGVYKAVVTSPVADIITAPSEWATAPIVVAANILIAPSVIG